ncbi:MAG: shikimate kinase [Cyclobacteriaceae bacterium]
MIPNKIYLIGLPATGKSYFGKKLAERLVHDFVDLDAYIEEKAGQTIAEIFSEKGEDYFRKLEAGALNEILGVQKSLIIATGGGTPCFHDGIDQMLSSGAVIFLDIDEAVLIERLSQSDKRPLVQSDVKETVAKLKAKRQSTYERAHIQILNRDVDALISKLENFNNSVL